MVRALGLIIWLFVASTFAQYAIATSFSGHRNHAHNLLGSNDLSNLNLHTGFFHFSESRLNIHGERSSAFYHLKPHATKLKVKVDTACFAVKCFSGKVVLTEKIVQSGMQPDTQDNCFYSSVSAMTSSPHFTGRTFAFSQKRPSLNDLRSGDLLHGDVKCQEGSLESESFTITSIHQQSDTTVGSSKRIYELNLKPATISDIVSEGEYGFHTENLLTVNDVEPPHVREQRLAARRLHCIIISCKWESYHDSTRRLVDLNWNFNEEEGREASNINLWSKNWQDSLFRGFMGQGSVDCTSCFASFKVDATIKFQVVAGTYWTGWPYLDVKFMAELSLRAVANVDVKFDFSASYDYEPPAKRLASISPMLNEALGNFNILGFPLVLGVTFGLDISVGVKFSAKSNLLLTVGADLVCNYKFGIYYNYDRPDQRHNGCQFQYHPTVFQVAGAIEVIPYVLLEPRVQVGFGQLLYGRATLQIKPSLVFDMRASNHALYKFNLNVNLKIPFSFLFTVGYDVSIPIISLKDEFKFGPYEIAKLDFKLVSINILRSTHTPDIRSLDSAAQAGFESGSSVMSVLSETNTSSPLSCDCVSNNNSIPWRSEYSNATLSSKTSTWTVTNGTLIDTCDFSTGNVDSISLLFTVSQTGFYNVIATVSEIAPGSESARWSAFTRIGPDCCGRFVLCASVHATRSQWVQTMFLTAGDVLSLVWSSNLTGSDAIITTSFVLDTEPVVYVDLYNGVNTNDGSRTSPVQLLEKGLQLLALKLSPTTTSATIIMKPTLRATIEREWVMMPSSPEGYRIPDVFKNVSLTIASWIARPAVDIFDAWRSQFYCNYLIEDCLSQPSFFSSVYGTSFDTELIARNSFTSGGRAFTLKDFKSITFDGLWIANFKNYDDGAAIYAQNSKVTFKNCFFKDNKALKAGRGSAIFSLNSNISITGSVFFNHLSKGNGGVIYAGGNSNVAIYHSFFENAVSDGEGGMIYFDASSPSAAMSVLATKFWQSSSFSGAAISFVGGRNNAKKNSIVASEFSGMAASDIGGSILLRDSNVDVSLTSFSNNFAVSGASSVESYASIVSLSGNKLNYSGAPQVSLFRATAYSDNASFFDNGGLYCPLPTCNPARLRNGQCDPICNISLCQFDGGDCLCDPNTCPPNLRGNGICDIGCASSGCKYDFGDCCDVSLCTLHMRNNSFCDALCNNAACDYDGGECPIPNKPAGSSMPPAPAPTPSHLAKFDTTSVLRTAQSPVLTAINQHAAQVIAQYDESLKTNSAAQTRATPVSAPVPTTMLCSSSSVTEQQSFITGRNVAVTIQSDSCSGLVSCKSCGSCGQCAPTGCDTSLYDNYCRMRGANWLCASVTPSESNNFSSTTCLDTSAAKPTPTATPATPPGPSADSKVSSADTPTGVLSPAAIAGISIAVVVSVALIAAAVFLKFKRRAVERSSTSSNIMMVEAHVDVAALQQEVSAAELPREDQSNALL